MRIEITSVNMQYSGNDVTGVRVHFTARDEGRTINLNGYISLTAEEYSGNESLSALEQIVRADVSNKLLEGSS